MNCCPSLLPGEATAGLDFQASVRLPDYPAPDWTLTALLRGPGSIDLTATADGAGHVFAANAAATAAWGDGAYWYSMRAAKGGSVVEVGKGQLVILKDLASITGPYDGRTQNQIALDAINAVLAKRATQDQQRYVINNRELWRTAIADLLKLRAFYATQVRRECNGGRRGFGRAIPVKFQ